MARAIAEHETVDGVLVAGSWARDERIVNPNYWSPRAYVELGLDELAASSRRLTRALAENGLPPDWATLEPLGAREPVYSYDAMRVPIRLVVSCDPEDRALAANMWPRLQTQPGSPRRALDGRPLSGQESAAALAGAAAAAHVAGADAGALLDRAAELEEERPTYYGSALVALARVALRSC